MKDAVRRVVMSCLLSAPAFLAAAEPVMQASIMRCDGGPITKTFGKADWRVFACTDGSLMLSPAPVNGASHPFTYRPNEAGDPFSGDRFRDDRAKAAYKELKALTTEQYDALIREVRASSNHGTETR